MEVNINNETDEEKLDLDKDDNSQGEENIKLDNKNELKNNKEQDNENLEDKIEEIEEENNEFIDNNYNNEEDSRLKDLENNNELNELIGYRENKNQEFEQENEKEGQEMPDDDIMLNEFEQEKEEDNTNIDPKDNNKLLRNDSNNVNKEYLKEMNGGDNDIEQINNNNYENNQMNNFMQSEEEKENEIQNNQIINNQLENYNENNEEYNDNFENNEIDDIEDFGNNNNYQNDNYNINNYNLYHNLDNNKDVNLNYENYDTDEIYDLDIEDYEDPQGMNNYINNEIRNQPYFDENNNYENEENNQYEFQNNQTLLIYKEQIKKLSVRNQGLEYENQELKNEIAKFQSIIVGNNNEFQRLEKLKKINNYLKNKDKENNINISKLINENKFLNNERQKLSKEVISLKLKLQNIKKNINIDKENNLLITNTEQNKETNFPKNTEENNLNNTDNNKANEEQINNMNENKKLFTELQNLKQYNKLLLIKIKEMEQVHKKKIQDKNNDIQRIINSIKNNNKKNKYNSNIYIKKLFQYGNQIDSLKEQKYIIEKQNLNLKNNLESLKIKLKYQKKENDTLKFHIGELENESNQLQESYQIEKNKIINEKETIIKNLTNIMNEKINNLGIFLQNKKFEYDLKIKEYENIIFKLQQKLKELSYLKNKNMVRNRSGNFFENNFMSNENSINNESNSNNPRYQSSKHFYPRKIINGIDYNNNYKVCYLKENKNKK